ncbi:uncharacterized protein LOC118756985 [Rhagoletis pomonella]|uniref:uncharacterized protein LOC118756985 n=1 Tax=Rhagoletis pomonella TaxID=28610 RepID=UPI001782D9E6|nr:uncharacterized protein LOC118756985 [Rhagoletis pomonella]
MPNMEGTASDDSRTEFKPILSQSSVIRPIQFNPDKPSLWFAQIEAQFTILGVSKEIDKFYHAISVIDARYAAEVEDIIVQPPGAKPYLTLKAALITRFSKSKEAKLQQLLEGEAIGDRTPSQFLRHLKSLVTGVGEDVIKAKWLSALPKDTRAMLALQSTASLDELGASADKLHEILQNRQTAAVTLSSGSTDLTTQILNLTKQVGALTTTFNNRQSRLGGRQQKPSRHMSRSHSRIRKLNSNGICYYHAKFGKDAKRSTEGCNFSGNAKESH